MKKYLKKTMSITLAGMMLASTVPAVNAASADTSFAQPCVVDYFNSFNGYVKTAGNNIKIPTPDGFNAHDLDDLNYRHQYLASGTADGANTYLKFTNVSDVHSGMQMKMDETINSGKLHISFDLKIDDLATFHGFDLRAINAAKNNNVNDWVQADGKTKDANNVLKLDGNKKIKLGTTDKESTTSTVDTYSTSWNKYDLIIDLDRDKMDFYINGAIKDSEVEYSQDIKALMFFTTTTDNNQINVTTTNMDNLFIKHYPDGNLGAPEMAVDYAGTAVPSSDATVYVGFSETVFDSDFQPTETDFAAVNVATGNEITPKSAVLVDGMVKLTFNTLPAGKYAIKVQDSAADYYTGKISNKAATVSNTFSVVGAEQNVKAENILVSDDFENYNGGMPANAVGLNLDKTHTGGTLEKVAGKNGSGSALKVTGFRNGDDVNVGSAIYKLPYAVTSGKLTYEFDINHANGMWFTGVLGAECFETNTYDSAEYTANKDKTSAEIPAPGAWKQLKLRENTIAVGCKSVSNANINEDNVQASLNKGNGFNNEVDNYWTNLVNGLTLEPNAWNHVKVEIDIDNAVQTITVGEGTSAVTKAFRVYGNRFRPSIRYKRKTVNGTEMWVKTMTAGIQGISLGAFGDTDDSGKDKLCTANNVTYDNLKVYTDNSYVDYSDFNKQVASTTNTISDKQNMPPAGWVKQNKEVNDSTGAGMFVSTEGQNNQKDTTDYAMQIKGTNELYSLVLSKPIPAQTAFEVSFDVKSVVPAANGSARSAWLLTLQTEDQVYTTFKNSRSAIVPFEAADETSKGQSTITDDRQHAYQSGPAIFGIQTDKTMDDTYAKMYLVGDDGSRHYLVGKQHINGLKNVDLPVVDPTVWNHVSLKAVPQTNGTFKFTACLNNDNSKSITWSSVIAGVINSNQAIHSIGLKNAHAEAARPMTIDNFKVELLNVAPTNIYVTDANAVSIANGAKTALSSGLAASGQKIEVNFSAPVASADAIKVYKYDGTATTAVNATKALSEDGKTATLTLNGIAVGDKLTLEVPNTVAPATNDGLSRVEATAVAFEVTPAADPEIKVEEFRLYKYYADGGKYSSSATSDPCWAPATANDVAKATAGDKFKFIAKGYNTGEDKTLQFIRALKDSDRRLESTVISDITLNTGTFAAGTTEFSITDTDGFINAYLWELSTLKPACDEFNAALPATQAE